MNMSAGRREIERTHPLQRAQGWATLVFCLNELFGLCLSSRIARSSCHQAIRGVATEGAGRKSLRLRSCGHTLHVNRGADMCPRNCAVTRKERPPLNPRIRSIANSRIAVLFVALVIAFGFSVRARSQA